MRTVTISLEQALDRIEDFRAIHEPDGVSMEAILCLQEAVGIDDATRMMISDRIYYPTAPGLPGATFLGVIIGLLAAGFESERRHN